MPLTAGEGKGLPRKGRPPSTPWAKMMRHPAVWAIILNNFTFHYAFYVVMIWLPTYFDKVNALSTSSFPWDGFVFKGPPCSLMTWYASYILQSGV